MTKKEKSEISRRHALQMLGAATAIPLFRSPVSMLLNSLVQGLISEARAEASGHRDPRNLIAFYMSSGAPRWHFDGSPDPYAPGGSNNGNKQVINGFANGSPTLVKQEFTFSQGRKLYLPPIWGSSLSNAGGTKVDMKELLKNALVIQGVNMLADGHSSNALALTMPNPSGPTYGGLIADASGTSIPAIALPASLTNHKAPSGGGIAIVSHYSDPLGQLLSPFQQKSTNTDFLSRRQAMDVAMKTALQKLGTFASSSDPAALSLFSAQGKAEKLLKESLGDLSSAFGALNTKYQAIMRKAIDDGKTGVAGVTDAAIPSSAFMGADKAQLRMVDGGNPVFASHADVRDIITGNTFIDFLAENFAIAEYMITRGYSQYVSAAFGIANRVLPGPGLNEMVVSGDEHEVGAVISLVINNARYRAFYACMNEFIEVLKAKGMWNNTVILYGSEFNRAARTDGSGSDHGFGANVYTMLSGAIDGPYYVGNTTNEWGVAGKTRVGSVEVDYLTRGYVASTVAALTRTASPSPNNASLLVEGSGGSFNLGNVEKSKLV